MTYRAPIADILSTLTVVTDLPALARLPGHGEATPDLIETVIGEAATFAEERIAPLNATGDRVGAALADGRVVAAPGFRETWRDWRDAGWNGLAADPAYGGQGLPLLLNAVCTELWNAGSLAFGLCPLLTAGAIEALAAHGSDTLKALYLPKLVAGEWTGTMNLTEPQAGSDLGALKARAERRDDGSYAITGQKIYITWGEHDLAENILHLVLARLPDAPAGTRGISLFLVPKILPDGTANDVRCHALEEKLGLHASPTCTMIYGDEGGATGFLIGEEHRGLACMFTMMNHARLAVGLQGVAVAERATQAALAYAAERRQGRAPGFAGEGMSPIAGHPDVRRMLAEMQAKTAAARAISYLAAEALDHAKAGPDEGVRRAAQHRAALLTPIAKAFSTDIAFEVASLGVQVHGGAGYIEATGAAQYLRDARILPIYEGTNGIQAIDLVLRKLPLDEGRAAAALIADLGTRLDRAASAHAALDSIAARLAGTLERVGEATLFMREAAETSLPDALAGATPYLRLFALAIGGVALAQQAAAVPVDARRLALARFFARQIASADTGLAESLAAGAAALDLG